MVTRTQLEQAIAAQEGLRPMLGDAVVDATIDLLQKQLIELSGAESGSKQRKLVTILFADVSGFTAMSEQMDAEDVSERMGMLWEPIDQLIRDHGGYIDKHIGDAVMALWGVDGVQENDPERAIRAALGMQKATEELNERLQLEIPFAMRIGINTGGVILGEVGKTGEYTAIGDPVNIASRLEHIAPLGGVLIAHDSYQQVQGIFDVQEQEAVLLKGKSDPMRTYLVLREKERAFRIPNLGVLGIQSSMVGRNEEMSQLKASFNKLMIEGEGDSFLIVGEAGIGKSRLLYEINEWVELHERAVFLFRGRAGFETFSKPLSLIRDIFRFRFQILEDDPIEVVYKKFESGIGAVFSGDEEPAMRAHFLGQMLGFDFRESQYIRDILDEPQQIKMRGNIYLHRYFQALAEEDPILFLLEDLQWIDEDSLELVKELVGMAEKGSLLLIMSSRPVVKEQIWYESLDHLSVLQLRPLDKSNSRQLVGEILHKLIDLPEALSELIISHAEGNPFYVEELIKMLLEDGVIKQGAQIWYVDPSKLFKLRIPVTLSGILQARLDSLSDEERLVVHQASVVGRIFWDQLLVHLAGVESGRMEQLLTQLESRELIVVSEERIQTDMKEYRFRHALLQEVAYQRVLKRDRKVYHSQIADWLLKESDFRADEILVHLAVHLNEAGREKEAAIYWYQAAVQIQKMGNLTEALHYLNRGLDSRVLQPVELQYDLLMLQEKLHDLMGNREAQAADLKELTLLIGTAGNREWEIELALREGNYQLVLSDYQMGIEQVQKAVELSKGVSEDLYSRSLVLWGTILWRQGSYQPAEERFKEALSILDDRSKERGGKLLADLYRGMGVVSYFLGETEKAQSAWQKTLEIYQQIGDRQGEGRTVNNLGLIANQLGAYDDGQKYYEQGLGLMQEVGDRYGESAALNNLATVANSLGQYEMGKRYCNQALEIMRQIGDRYGESSTLSNLGMIAMVQGDYPDAEAYFQQAILMMREIGYRDGEGITLNNLGQLSLRKESYQDAVLFYEQAELIRAESSQIHYCAEDWAGLSAGWYALGERDKSWDYIEKLVNYWATNETFEGAERPFYLFLQLIRLLKAFEDERWRVILDRAVALLEERAEKISDIRLRRSFLEQVWEHREILAFVR